VRILWCSWKDRAHPLAGGAEVYTHAVTSELAARGHDVHLACSHVLDRPDDETVDGVHVHRSGGPLLGVYQGARRRYERSWDQWDLVIDEVNTRPFSAPLWVRSTPVLGFCHQLAREVWSYEAPLPAALLGRYVLEPTWWRRYRDTPVAAVSQSTATSLAECGVRDTFVLPMGSQFPPRPQTPRAAQPTVAVLGRISQMKRPLEVLAAHRLLLRSRPDARLWFIGDGPEAPALRRAASGVPGVEVLGRLDEQEKAERLAAAWVLTSASVREGWGLVVSEAAAMGTFSVTYRVPGLIDSVTATGGVLCDPHPDALAAALEANLDRFRDSSPAGTGTVPWSETADAFEGLALRVAGRHR
jgi:glycosyltransferase involved in cell wall biosynthesis